MRLRLNLSCKNDAILSKDYYPQLLAAIYNILSNGDNEYARWLHDNGYIKGHKQLKFFTFSSIILHPPFGNDSRQRQFHISSGKAEFFISLLSDEAKKHFVKGMFTDQRIVLKGYGNNITFDISGIEVMPEPEFRNVAEFKTISPICISLQNTDSPQGKHLKPLVDSEYTDLFIRNLKTKYELAQSLNLIDTAKPFKEEDIRLEFLSEPIQKMITTKKIKNGKDIKYKCFDYRFRLHAPSELIHLAYTVGFGVQTGLGCVDVI